MRITLDGPGYQALRRAVRALGVIALALGSVGAAGARADISGPTIVGHVNAQRMAQGIPAAIVHDATLSDGCAKHNAYGRLNNVLVHEEDPALEGFTPQGDQAARTSVLYRGSNAWTATRNPFETAPIHLHGLLAARLDRMGASEDQGYGCATTLASRNRPAPPTDRTYTYPGNGATGWVRSQLASESPYTPGEKAAPPIAAGTTTGPYLYVMFDGPTLTAFDNATATGATLTGPQGVVVTVARVGNTTPGLEPYLPTGMQVIPREPLLPGTTYTASVTASVTTQGGGGPARSFSHTWSFTTEALPDTSITSGPSGTVASSAASFAFTSTKPDSSFECKLDAGGWVFCATPKSLTALSEGPHTWSVRATDQSGNVDPSPATRSWTVDTTAPQTTIDSGPSGSVQQTGATFTMSSSEAGSSFECRLDAGAWAACASPRTLSGLADGEHTFAVRATDAIGNAASTATTRSWTVDTVAPLSPTPTDTDPDSPANDGAPRVKGTAAAGSTVRLHTDMFCSSVVAATGSAADFAAPGLAVSVADGSSQTFWATATDQAGNRSACSSSSITYSDVAVAIPPPPPPPPPPPAPPPPPVDDTAPAARLGGGASQRLGKTVRVSVLCPDEACLATARGTVAVPRIGRSKAKVYTLPKAARDIGKGAKATLLPKLSYSARVAIGRALRRHRGITVKLRVTVADATGNIRSLTRQVKLRR